MGTSLKAVKTLFVFVQIMILFAPSALGEDYKKEVELYNKATLSKDFNEKEKLFKEALTLPCKDDKIVAKIHNNL